MSADNITPFPPSLHDGVRRPATLEPVPPLTRSLALMVDYARAARRQTDLREALENLRQLARVPLPTISPAATRSVQMVRLALIDETLHALMPDADERMTQLLDGIAALLRQMESPK
jgi:hypothetical protein